MLEDFKENSFYEYANNLEKFYHAYLFEVDNLEVSFPLILAFAKTIICENHYKNLNKCGDCNICHLIDKNYYEGLKIIEPEGMLIKKEQVLELQKKLSLKSSNNLNQVYIIKEAEKMNASASNSILKFIEEPEPGIYGILITTNRKQILPTILSRCILISLKTKNELEIKEEDLKQLVRFISNINNQKENYLPYLKRDFFSFYETREDVLKAFSIMELILDAFIHEYYHIKPLLKSNYCDIIKTSFEGISLLKVIFYLEKIILYKNKLTTVLNLNLNLFMDRFLIEMSEVIK